MTITVDISAEVQAELARQAAAYGRGLEAHAASLLEDAAHRPADRNPPGFDKERAQAAGARIRELSEGLPTGTMTPAEAVADIRELRKGVTLGGLRIKDLINEGRRH